MITVSIAIFFPARSASAASSARVAGALVGTVARIPILSPAATACAAMGSSMLNRGTRMKRRASCVATPMVVQEHMITSAPPASAAIAYSTMRRMTAGVGPPFGIDSDNRESSMMFTISTSGLAWANSRPKGSRTDLSYQLTVWIRASFCFIESPARWPETRTAPSFCGSR